MSCCRCTEKQLAEMHYLAGIGQLVSSPILEHVLYVHLGQRAISDHSAVAEKPETFNRIHKIHQSCHCQ